MGEMVSLRHRGGWAVRRQRDHVSGHTVKIGFHFNHLSPSLRGFPSSLNYSYSYSVLLCNSQPPYIRHKPRNPITRCNGQTERRYMQQRRLYPGGPITVVRCSGDRPTEQANKQINNEMARMAMERRPKRRGCRETPWNRNIYNENADAVERAASKAVGSWGSMKHHLRRYRQPLDPHGRASYRDDLPSRRSTHRAPPQPDCFQIPPPTALLMPNPTATATPTITAAINALTQNFVRLSKFLIGFQHSPRLLSCFFACFSARCPGHTVQSLLLEVFFSVSVLLELDSVRHASMSDS